MTNSLYQYAVSCRASNPGLFEPDSEVSWSKNAASDTVYHLGECVLGIRPVCHPGRGGGGGWLLVRRLFEIFS